jgi:hypothetical protein
MSGGAVRISFDGQDYVMPEDEAQKAMKMLDARGTKFTAQDAPHEAGVFSEPDPTLDDNAPKPAPQPPAAAPDDRPGWLRGLADAMRGQEDRQSQMENGAAEYGAPGLGGLIYGASGHALDPMRDERLKQTPGQAAVSDTAGAFASPLNFGGSVLRNAASGAIQGGMRGYNDAPDDDHRAISGLLGAAAGGAAPLALGAIAAPFNKTSELAQSVGDSARLSSMGVGKQALTDFADKGGMTADEARRAFVSRAEELVPPNRIVPRSTGGWETAARPVADDLGRAVDQGLIDASRDGALLPSDVRGNLQQSLYESADAKMGSGFGGAVPEANALSNEAYAVGRGPQIDDPLALRQAKTMADRYAFRGTPGTPEAAAGMASLEHGNAIRGLLGDFVDQASPEIGAAYRQSAGDYGIASTIQNQARDRALGMAASAPTGARSAFGRTLDAVSGGGVVPDAFANLSRGVEGLTGAVGGGASWLARDAPTGTALAVAMDQGRPTPSGNPSYDRQTAAGESRGYQLSQNLDRALATQPQLLGSYAQQFAGVDDPDQRAAIAERLARTDTRFARDVYPSLIGAR